MPVVNENDTVATEEIRFGDNDRLAALVAHLVHADLLVLLSDVDGLYDGDPRRRARAGSADVAGPEDLDGVRLGRGGSGVGTGGMATKVEAARIATAAGVRAVVAGADQAGAVLAGAERGHVVRGRRGRGSRPAALARARDDPARQPQPGRRGGAGGRRAADVAAARRA